jgi:rhomboid protease GluP
MGSSPPPTGYPMRPPEVLSPVGGAEQQQELQAVRQRLPGQRALSRSWAYAPATYILVAINCLVFLVMVLNHVPIVSPDGNQLMQWQANNAGAVLHDGQWWRIFTAMFVHAGILHLATNMWCLWNLGLLGEPLIGPIGVLAAYVFSGAAGNLLSIGVSMVMTDAYRTGGPPGVGASGAVFGLAGVLIVLLRSPRLPIPAKELSGLRRYVMYFAVINFVIGFGSLAVGSAVKIDNMAHLGGFLGGIIFALPLVPLLGSPKSLFLMRRRVAIVMMTGVLVFFGFYLSNVFPPSCFQP